MDGGVEVGAECVKLEGIGLGMSHRNVTPVWRSWVRPSVVLEVSRGVASKSAEG